MVSPAYSTEYRLKTEAMIKRYKPNSSLIMIIMNKPNRTGKINTENPSIDISLENIKAREKITPN